MNHECPVLLFTQDLIQEGITGTAFLSENPPLAQACVYKQPYCQGKVAFPREISNRLRMAVFFQIEIVFGQVIDNLPLLVPDRREHVDHIDINRQGRTFLAPKLPVA